MPRNVVTVTQFYNNYGTDSDPPTPTFQFCPAARRSSRKSRTGPGGRSNVDYTTAVQQPSPSSSIDAGGPPQQQQQQQPTSTASVEHHQRPRLSLATNAESGYSEYSTTSTMITTAAGRKAQYAQQLSQTSTSSAAQMAVDSPPAIESPGGEEMAQRGRGRRRHAINITSNPCYQVSEFIANCASTANALRLMAFQKYFMQSVILSGTNGVRSQGCPR